MNQFLITQIQDFMNSQEREKHEKTSFWATDCEKPLLDLYHGWKGTEATNPIEAEKLMMFNVGKMMEESLIGTLKQMGVLEEVEDSKQHRIEMERCGVPVSGYMDGLLMGNVPLEIKSFYGDYQARELKAGKPRTSYLKQLAIYMDFKQATKGKLIYIHRGTGEIFEFTLLRNGTAFKCMSIEFDLNDTYNRWARLYKNNVLKDIEPTPDKKYKQPIETIDWATISKADIGKARNNHKVIGDWEVIYSPYLNRYLEIEETTRGYTNAELEKIKEITKGYSTWGK